jgi:hypothetical protein
MSSQLAPLLRNEAAKAIRRKLPLFSIAATWVLCLLVHVAAEQLGNAASANAWGYVGLSRAALELAVKYASEREIGGKKVTKYQFQVYSGSIIKIGKHRFVKVINTD